MSRYLQTAFVLAVLPAGAAQAQWLDTTVSFGLGTHPYALVYDSVNNKASCANDSSDNVTVVGGASNRVDTTVGAGSNPSALCYNPQDDKVYCANQGSDNVTVTDATSNQVVTTVSAGFEPWALCYNPQNTEGSSSGPEDVGKTRHRFRDSQVRD